MARSPASRIPHPLRLALITIGLLAGPALAGSPVRLVRADADGLVLDVEMGMPPLRQVEIEGRLFDDVVAPGLPRLAVPGHANLPFVAELIAVPPGARVDVEVLEQDSAELDNISYLPAPGEPIAALNPEVHSTDAFAPSSPVAVSELGILRGVRAFSLHLYPVQYNPVRRMLRIARHLRVRVSFEGGSGKLAPASQDLLARRFPAPFLNPPTSTVAPAPSAKPTADPVEWYDPGHPWVKAHVTEDGIYRIGPGWLRELGVEPESIDPRTFRLLYLGEEQYLHAAGQDDGRFDEDDYLLFHGRHRRDAVELGPSKDFESLYGSENTYWLTWDGDAGLRFVSRTGAPTNGYPASPSYWTTTHFERDLHYQQFEFAPDDAVGDHWFWQNDRPFTATSPDTPAAQTFTGYLSAPSLLEDYTANLRVALHGNVSVGQHHNAIKLNGHLVADDLIWEGQVPLIVETDIPSSHLRPGTNRLILQGWADLVGRDEIWFNWFEIRHRRQYAAGPGFLAYEEPASSGRHTTLSGFSSPQIELFDVANGYRYTDLGLIATGETFAVEFEDRSDAPSAYVIADTSQFHAPQGQVDEPSAWRRPDHAAEYILITHSLFRDAAERLADHRRSRGLTVEVVLTEDLYDEFSYGRFTSDAIRDFIAYAYRQWQQRPAYVLLLGDGTWDYRGIYGSHIPSFIPTLYYDARGRGISPSDVLYSLVDGDDLLPDLAVSRVAAESGQEADGAVDKIIRYDLAPAPGDWRSRVVYLANFDELGKFTLPSDELATRFTEPLGLQSVKIYSPDDAFIPNLTGRIFLDALNAGALLVNFAGHGSAGSLQYVFSIDYPDWDYLSWVDNGDRLPLVLALSCLNGQFAFPQGRVNALGEVFTRMPSGGAIAYVGASAKGFPIENDLLAEKLYDELFGRGNLSFGMALNAAKIRMQAAHSSYETAVLTMQLFGDPAQELALAPAPDYAAVSLDLSPAEVLGHSTVSVQGALRNNTRLGPDSLVVSLILSHDDQVDTLVRVPRAAFAGVDTLSFGWEVGDRRGFHQLALVVEPAAGSVELEPANNQLVLDLDILEAALAAPVFPPPEAILRLEGVVLEASVPLDGQLESTRYTCEFALSTEPAFGPDALLSSTVPTERGICGFAPSALPLAADATGVDPTIYYWRSRAIHSGGRGPWSSIRSFRLASEATSGLPAGQVRWAQTGPQLLTGSIEHLSLDPDGSLGIDPAPLPLRPSSSTREDDFAVQDLDGAGVLCADGTYLYAKRWFNDASTVYPGSDVFTRIGTGLNGTIRGTNYGAFGDTTTAGISATYHSDGYVYSESGRARELERLDAATGHLDTVAVPDGLLEWKHGQVVDGHSLITSDGQFVYNVSMSSPTGIRTGWGVRVFDPADGWRLVREFTSPPTQIGFTFEWMDGILADGQRLYLIEYGGQRRIRMVDAMDGRFLDEWRSDQDTTRIVSGQYDGDNNAVWLGDLLGPKIFRYAGTQRLQEGLLASPAIGPAARWGHLRVRVARPAGTHLKLALQAPDSEGNWRVLPEYTDLLSSVEGGTAETTLEADLSATSAVTHPVLRLHAEFSGPSTGSTGSARLAEWELTYTPRPTVELGGATAELVPQPDSGQVQIRVAVRNRSPVEVADLELRVETHDGVVLTERALSPLERGETRVLTDTFDVSQVGTRLFARVVGGPSGDDPVNARLEIPLLLAGRAALSIRHWPSRRAFLDGDPLRPGEGLLITAPLAQDGRIAVAIDGEPAPADSAISSGGAQGIQILYRPRLDPGEHRLQAHLFLGLEEIGAIALNLRLVEDLSLAAVLVHPHPVREQAAFTFVLSHPAQVWVEIFSLSGRLVRRLEQPNLPAGFARMAWDARDQAGHPLASGTYLYRLTARAGERHVQVRRPLVIVRRD